MNPYTQAGSTSMIDAARNQGQQLQNQYNTQAAQQYGNYQNATSQANNAYGQAQGANQTYLNYLNNLPQTYSQDLSRFGGQLGYNPQATQNAAQNSANLAEAYANAPQAAQQMSNYSGATAGQMNQALSSMAGNLQGASAQANQMYQNQLAGQQNLIGAVQGLTNQQSTGMGQYASNANSLYSNAVGQMQQAGSTMAQIEQLQQQQGYATAQQVAAYQNAYSQYVQASASANLANAQAQQQQMQNQQTQSYMNSQAYQNYLKYGSTTGPQQQAKSAGSGLNINVNGKPVSKLINSAVNAAGNAFANIPGIGESIGNTIMPGVGGLLGTMGSNIAGLL